MKRTLLIVFPSIIFICFGCLFLNSCKDDKDCGVLVIAKDAIDTNVLIKNAKVVIGQKGASINQVGWTDSGGESKFTFKNPAILNVDAQLTINYRGNTSVRLVEGETVTIVVLMKQY